MTHKLQEGREGEHKLGDPGFLRIHAEDRTFTKRIISTHPKGYGGETEPLSEPERRTVYGCLGKFYGTEYKKTSLGENISGNSMEELAAQIKEKQTGKGNGKYIYACKRTPERHAALQDGKSEGTNHIRNLTSKRKPPCWHLSKKERAAGHRCNTP